MARFKLVIVLTLMIALIIGGIFSYFSRSRICEEEPKSLSSEGEIDLGSVEHCKLTVVVDNYGDSELEVAWGLSILIETPSSKILFDTGPNPDILERNLRKLGIDVDEIDSVVISHEHGDHIGGLSYLAKTKPEITVYVPKATSEKIRAPNLKIIEVNDTMKIAEGIALIGWLYGPPIEQSLAVNVKGLGLVIATGCSHPSVVNIVAKAVRDLNLKPYLVIGGFHMGGATSTMCRKTIQYLIDLGVEKMAPIHCSGEHIRLILKQEFQDHWLECHVGCIISLP